MRVLCLAAIAAFGILLAGCSKPAEPVAPTPIPGAPPAQPGGSLVDTSKLPGAPAANDKSVPAQDFREGKS